MPFRIPDRPRAILLLLLVTLLTACGQPAAGHSATLPPAPSPTPTHSPRPTQTAEPAPAPTPTPLQLRVWLSPELPTGFREALALPGAIEPAPGRDAANLWFEITSLSGDELPGGPAPSAAWIYAVVAPFPTLVDSVSLVDIQNAWNGVPGRPFDSSPLLMTAETRAVLESAWGPADPAGVRVVDQAELLETAWQEAGAWAIVPFEAIEPRWKVLRISGRSPLDRLFDPAAYPLTLWLRLAGTEEALRALPSELALPSNRDPDRLTVVVLTGVTALSRHIAAAMESQGITYPARDIRAWLAGADLTHISNEVSFYADCPKPGPQRADMRFCSHPSYIGLLEEAGADIIELTGNHNLDWGTQPYLDTLEMYRERGWLYYGGGANLSEAQRPLRIEHNGNRLAFLGCSPAGPEAVWARNDRPGSAPCDWPALEAEIARLRAEGYQPVVTLQHFETESYVPAVAQGAPDFRRLAEAGAAVVSGSQSHYPQTMTFIGDRFVHYGLGNLFFDQMNRLETRQGFIDRHVFYDGRYLGVELLTTLLEDSARPRPMDRVERRLFLETIFSLSDWSGTK